MMTRERTLGPTETRLLNRLAADGQVVFTTDQARAALGDADQNINKLLYRLTRKRWLLRLEKGKYLLLPLEAGTEGRYTVHEFVIAAHLIQPYAIAYASALHYWHMTEQLPHTVFVQSTSRKHQREKEVLGVPYRFVTVVESKFFGVVDRTLDGQPIYVTDREKTLVDAADRPDLSGGIVQLAQALRVARDDLDWRILDDYLDRWPTGSPKKRIGYLVESLELPFSDREERLACWRRSLSSGIVAFEPGHRSRQGRTVTRWRLRVNVDETWRTREGSR
jgi:predicted transcriptional regulator of viral defense system